MNTADVIQILIYVLIGIWVVLIIAGCIMWRNWIKRLAAIGVLGIILFQFIVFPMFLFVADTQGEAHLSAYFDGHQNVNQFYNDVSEYRYPSEDFEPFETRSIVSSATILNGPLVDPESSLYVCIGVERRFDPAEIDAILQFCAEGGHCIIADDHGFINDLSHKVGVLSLEGQFLDENFDKNQNFTVVKAYLGKDMYENGLATNFEERSQSLRADGLWDGDNDADGKIDEDPYNNIDDDEDNGIFENDLQDNDFDENVDEAREGVDEDPIDDDGDGEDNDNNENTPPIPDGKDNDGDGEVDEGFNEEMLDGWDNDGDDYIDEDLFQYTLILNDATGFISEGTRVISYGSERSFVDMDGDSKISIPDENTLRKGKLADEISSPGHEVQLIVESLVSPDQTQIDVTNGKWIDASGDEYDPPSDFNIKEAGSIVFISDPALFIDDEYTLDHISFDVRKPYRNVGNGIDDDLDGLIDEDREIAAETGISDNDLEKKDKNLVRDNTGGDYIIPGNLTSMEIAKQKYPSSMLDRDERTDEIIIKAYDYDNAMFIEQLIYHLMPDGGIIIFDESRHEQSTEGLVPVYKGLSRLTWITSSPWLSISITVSAAIILAFAVMVIREKENWVHRFNITQLSSRKNLPVTPQAQASALRRSLLEKIRLTRGLSPEEFEGLDNTKILVSVKDPELRQLITNESMTYPSQKVSELTDKIKRFGK